MELCHEGLSLGIIVDHLHPTSPPPSIDTMESQTVSARSVYSEGRGSGEHNELRWLRMKLAWSVSAVVLIFVSA